MGGRSQRSAACTGYGFGSSWGGHYIVGASTPGALAAKAVTQTIPIVFFIGTDPVKVGLVTSLAQPGGNITGITVLTVELIAKSLELMHNLMPPATTIAVLVNPANIPQTATERGNVLDAAGVLGARVVILNASSPSEIESAFATVVSEGVGALVVSGDGAYSHARSVEMMFGGVTRTLLK